MYIAHARIRGVAPILQHKYGAATLETLMQGANKKSGAPDYRYEWIETMYTSNGWVVQPAAHIEGALVRAGVKFTIKGQKGKTYKDLMKTVYVLPDEIPHLWNGECVPEPDESLNLGPVEPLSVSVMRVVVNRAAIARARLQIATGWELAFDMQVNDDQLKPDDTLAILTEAGRTVGIGDNRPRYGRFEVVDFRVA